MAATKPKTARMRCPGCGVEANCDCGVVFISAGEYARRQLAARPELAMVSSRAVAKELGVSHHTANRAMSTVSNETIRLGLDGKKRPAVRKPKLVVDNVEPEPKLVVDNVEPEPTHIPEAVKIPHEGGPFGGAPYPEAVVAVLNENSWAFRVKEARLFATYSPAETCPQTPEMLAAVRATHAAWTAVLNLLEGVML